MPTSEESLRLIDDLSALRGRLAGSGTDAEDASREAWRLSRKLTASLEDPVSAAVNVAFSPFVGISARIAVHMDLFKEIAKLGSGGASVTSTQLAEATGAEELLIGRRDPFLAGFRSY